MSPQNDLAKKFAQLHKPGKPILLVNVWDVPSTKAAAENPRTPAIATASYAIAAVAGTKDPELTWEENFEACKKIATYLKKEGKLDTLPMTVDLQEGYGDRLEEAITGLIDIGVVGINLEDSIPEQHGGGLRDPSEQATRIKQVKSIAASKGVPDFFVNARTDAVLLGGTVDEALTRGKAYLSAGADCIFVWGGPAHVSKRPGGGLRDAEVKRLVAEFDGKVNVHLPLERQDGLNVGQIAKLGVSRISVGPRIWMYAMECFGKRMEELLQSPM